MSYVSILSNLFLTLTPDLRVSEYLTESFKSRPNRIERSVVDLKRRWWQSDCGGHVLWETCYWMRERDKERKRDRERKEERERKKDKERKKERKKEKKEGR